MASTTPSRPPGSLKRPKKIPRPVAVLESLFERGSETEPNPAEAIEELTETLTVSDGFFLNPAPSRYHRDGGSFRAQLMVPCEFVLPVERKRFLKEWGDADLKKAEKRDRSQNNLVALSDWEFRRKTASRHCIQKRFSTNRELLDYREHGEDGVTKILMVWPTKKAVSLVIRTRTIPLQTGFLPLPAQ